MNLQVTLKKPKQKQTKTKTKSIFDLYAFLHILNEFSGHIEKNNRNKQKLKLNPFLICMNFQVTFKKRPKQTKTVKKSDHDSSLVLEEDAEESVTRPVTR